MLRFSAGRLLREKWEESQDAWVYLESFLVHYRNLIEFLGKKENVRRNDLNIKKSWGLLKIPPPTDVDKIHAAGAALWQEYGHRISKHLQHCTIERTESTNWPIDVMNGRIEPLLAQVESALRSQAANSFFRPIQAQAVQFTAPHPASAQVYTPVASVISSVIITPPRTPSDESK